MKYCSKNWLAVFAILIATVNNVVCNSMFGTNKAANTLTQNIINYVDANQVRTYLFELTAKPHLAGTEHNLVQYVHDTWLQQGLDEVTDYSYDVLLSYPNPDDPNRVNIIDGDTSEVIHRSAWKQEPLNSPEENDETLVPNFNAYSRAGHIQQGDLVYAHYGQQEDFDWLVENGVELSGKIVLARYGASFRGNIVSLAHDHGAVGVILYSDPEDYAPNGRDDVYPDSVYLPGTGAQVGTLLVPNGDPLTPDYPSVVGAYRIPIEEAYLPKIPVQPIGYDDAEQFLQRLGGLNPPAEWVGTLNASYNIGPGFTDSNLKVELYVNTTDQRKIVTNVIGVIQGSVEPDRYVVLGNHRDAWHLGGIDPSSGTAALLEVTRVLSRLTKEGWKPRRTIMFCSWDAEEYGLLGSQEWVEEHLKTLKDRTVAYINVDAAADGNETLGAQALSTLHAVLYEASKQIPNPDQEEVTKGRKTIYDTWLYKTPEESPIFNEAVPYISVPGSGSDHAPFLLSAGIPIFNMYYTSQTGSPLYHTIYETFYDVEVLVDPGFKFHAAMTQLWAELARSLADAELLPFNVEHYGYFLQDAYKDVESNFGQKLTEHDISLDYFAKAIEYFAATAKTFQLHLASLDLDCPMAVRIANDQLMQFERAFLQPEGLPAKNRNYLKHVVYAPSKFDQYGGSVFASFTDLIVEAEQAESDGDWEKVEKELSAVVYFIRSAASVLADTYIPSCVTRGTASSLPQSWLTVSLGVVFVSLYQYGSRQ